MWADLEGWRRNKRDLEDRLVLASRRAALRSKHPTSDGGGASSGEGVAATQRDEDFAVDDGDEDAWVHDGIDDIHIDPETKRAASEHSYDEKSIDAEYDPHQKQESNVVNKTRVTTIAEVIPMNVDAFDQEEAPSSQVMSSSSSSTSRMQHDKHNQHQHKPTGADSTRRQQMAQQRQVHMQPAAHLTIEQAQRVVEDQAAPKFWGSESAPSLMSVLMLTPPASSSPEAASSTKTKTKTTTPRATTMSAGREQVLRAH